MGPVGLEYVAEALRDAGFGIDILDLCWEEDWKISLSRFFNDKSFDLVGITLRNTDDCALASRRSFLDEFVSIVSAIGEASAAPLVLGGGGFSVMPVEILKLCRASAGIWGDGEFAFVELAQRLKRGKEWLDVPNLIWPADGIWRRNPPSAPPLNGLPRMKRDIFDNQRYFREGGQAGIEMKRGCAERCVYCADPVARGRAVRTRPPSEIVDELECLVRQGIDHIHTCDSEFNLPPVHAREVCREIIRRKLGDKLNLYTYCSPVPFPVELAGLMKKAGFVGINFGVDSGNDRMLKSLGRDFRAVDILNTTRRCRREGITVMLDLLIGAPGESRQSIIDTIDLMKRSGSELMGVALGVRIYPGTALGRMIEEGYLKEGLIGGGKPTEPLFYLEPRITPFASGLLDELIGDDKRFFFFDPRRPDRNYNYHANQVLIDAIGKGHRGAYWDILRRISD